MWTLVEKVVGAVAMPKVVKLPKSVRPQSITHNVSTDMSPRQFAYRGK